MKVVHVTAAFLLVISSISNSFSQTVSRGTLRLVRNEQPSLTQAWSSGIVQIYYNNNWGNICDDTSFGGTEADVVCHQLSYTGASTYTNTAWSTSFGTDDSTTLLEDVSCSSSDLLVLLQCSVTEQYSASCSSSTQYDVIVQCYTVRIWDSNPFPGQIRLVGGTYSNTGLLQVYCNGQWGTVCDDYYGITDARVSCNQLGYNDYTNYDHLSITGNVSDPIWIRTISCSSPSQKCFSDCTQCPSSKQTGCTHSEDITLDCAYSSTQPFSNVTELSCMAISDTTGPSSVGAMRLLNDGSTSLYNTAGRVQVWYGGQWGNICDDFSFGFDEADVICHQLQWSGASGYSYALVDNFDNDNLPTVIDDLNCFRSGYLTIFQCSYSTTISSSCTSDRDVSVTCYTTRIWDSAYTGQIRLSRGQYSNQGLLEVYCNGQWGTVCDDSFGSNEATVACRQLGYSNHYSYDSLSITGNISQRIWFDELYCSSSRYNCLANCMTCPASEYDDCSHSEDITLECSVASSNNVYTTTSSCDGVDTDSSDTGSSSSGLVGGIVGSTFFIIFISIAIPVCILVCATSRARSSIRTTRIVAQPQPYTTATVVTTSAEIPLQQVPPTNPVASYPVQGYTNQQNPPYNPSSTAYSNVYGQGYPQYPYQPAPSEYTTTPQQPVPSEYTTTPQQPVPSEYTTTPQQPVPSEYTTTPQQPVPSEYTTTPQQPVPSEYTTTPQQPPPSYSEFLQNQYPAGGTGGTVPPPYPV